MPSAPSVTIDPELSPRLSPDQVTTRALTQIHDMERLAGQVAASPRIVSMHAFWMQDVGEQPEIEWKVRVEGTCVSQRLRPGERPATACTLTISDVTRDVLGFEEP